MTTWQPIARQPVARASNKFEKIGLARALSKLGFRSRTQAMARIRLLFDQPLLRSVKRKNSDCFATGSASWLSAAIWD